MEESYDEKVIQRVGGRITESEFYLISLYTQLYLSIFNIRKL